MTLETTLTERVCDTKHNISWESLSHHHEQLLRSKTLPRNVDMKMNHHALNRDDGSY